MKTTYDKIRWGLLAVIYILFYNMGKIKYSYNNKQFIISIATSN